MEGGYRTIAAGAGWAERRDRGVVTISGADRVAFLQALVTNDLSGRAPGDGVYAAYLTPQGRMIADLAIYLQADRVTCDVPAPGAAALALRLDALVFAEDVAVHDRSAEIAQVAIVGEAAPRVIARAAGAVEAAIADLRLRGHLQTTLGLVAATDDSRLPSFVLFTPRDALASTIASLESAGALAMSTGVADALRIEAGRPAFGRDMTAETIPLEAGLLGRAISTDKGCYVGQEVVIRVLHRGGGRVARRLVRIGFASAPGAGLSADGREVGRVTSAAYSPGEGRWLALGYVPRDVADRGGRIVSSAGAGDVAGEILGLAG
jgi:folate-binding protein YgfZ